jgi:hypothetical protein
MSRRWVINVSAVAVLIVFLFLVARSTNYTPSTAPRHALVRQEIGGPGPGPSEAPPVDSQATPDSAGGGTDSAAVPGIAAVAEAPSLLHAALVRHAEIGFESRERLLEHFDKHGAEFGAATPDGYLLLAQALRDRAVGGPVIEARRSDGVTTRFDRGSGAFLAFESDGTIRTFFRPNDGENYFWRQLGRPH